MNVLRNPWLSGVAALAVLGIWARIETPRAALAIGLPIVAAVWIVWSMRDRLPARLMTTPPRALIQGAVGGVSRTLAIVVVALGVLAFAYLSWGLFTERGLIGWLNAVQAERDGHFSTKLSFIVGMLDLMWAITLPAVLWGLLSRRSGAAGPQGSAAMPSPHAAVPPRTPADSMKTAYAMLAALVALPWAVGYPVYRWIAAEHREDVTAQYERVVLDGPTTVLPTSGRVALEARPAGQHVITLGAKNQSSKTFFVPLTGPRWTDAEPVTLVLTFEAETPPMLDRPILARLSRQPLKPPVVDAFARDGVRFAADYRVAELIPSFQGKVNDRSGDDWLGFLVVAGLVSGISALTLLALWVRSMFKRPPRRT